MQENKAAEMLELVVVVVVVGTTSTSTGAKLSTTIWETKPVGTKPDSPSNKPPTCKFNCRILV